ncbi:MAG: MgtC/SapB family protein [bacterium]|nr:MgtC/SapB family protein [bacterium]
MEIVIPFAVITKLLLALGLGALVGIEREIRKKPAGIRTHALVAFGSALFTIIALEMFSLAEPDAISRVLQGVIVGIGFLGAGIIFQAKGAIKGLTTAAEVWALAGIGILAGLGAFSIAISAAVLVLVILIPLRWFERSVEEHIDD